MIHHFVKCYCHKLLPYLSTPFERRLSLYNLDSYVAPCIFRAMSRHITPEHICVTRARESKTTPQNCFLFKLSYLGKNDIPEVQITDFKHPQPDLLGISKELVQYKREDEVQLTANLYLPANYDGTPRPTLFWAYPREYKDADAAGQVNGSKHRFVSAHWASPIHWAAKGWVVMDDFSLPVIGEGDAQPNDTFIEQLISSATSAVNYVTARGVCDPRRCAVGGHSYGSFMTAHLLSHTSLFAAGIGRSGAFNRTLTPMSFQVTFVSPSFLLVLLSSSHLLYCIRDSQRKGAYGMHQTL